MMRSRGTLTLVLLAGALLGYILLFERHQPDPAARQTQTKRLLPDLDPTRVTALTIVQTNGTTQVERTDAGWHLTSPTHPALGMLVDQWLESLSQLTLGAHLDASDVLAQPGGLAALGLEPPRATITVDLGSRRIQLRLGQRAPLGNRVYVQIVGSNGVEMTGSQPFDALPASPLEWRDPALVHLVGKRVDRLDLRTPAREYQVRREPGTGLWRLERPRPARADHGRVEQILLQLGEARIAQFASDIVTADLEPFGLQTPAGELTLYGGTNQLLRLTFGRSPTNAPDTIYVQRSSPPGIVLAPRSIFDSVAVSYSELLDYRMVDRPLDSLQRVETEINGGGKFTLEKGPDGVWHLTEPIARPTDPALVVNFLDRLRGLRAVEVAKEVVDDAELPVYGLGSPVRRYTLQWRAEGTNQPTVLRLDLGTNRTDRVMARRSDENPIYSLALEDCVPLPAAPLQLRDRRIWNFTTNQVQGVTVTHHSRTNHLLRSTTGQWSFAPGSQGMVNTYALEEAIHRFGQLRASWWETEGPGIPLERFGVPQVAHQLTVGLLVNGRPESRVLDFGATSRSGGPYGVTQLEGGPAVFEVPLDIFHPYDEVVRSMALPKPGADTGSK